LPSRPHHAQRTQFGHASDTDQATGSRARQRKAIVGAVAKLVEEAVGEAWDVGQALRLGRVHAEVEPLDGT